MQRTPCSGGPVLNVPRGGGPSDTVFPALAAARRVAAPVRGQRAAWPGPGLAPLCGVPSHFACPRCSAHVPHRSNITPNPTLGPLAADRAKNSIQM